MQEYKKRQVIVAIKVIDGVCETQCLTDGKIEDVTLALANLEIVKEGLLSVFKNKSKMSSTRLEK
ncbi:MAG: hypothetical protein CL811_12365 [Colwelliaceae bacterium]|jgi:hypothetical protein|nr:hypothetical protein [Colwelliaceae bacterium]|tara:strand:- start:948 stop:1142 length:195 start_codon:yes stop_codon:yes gene_type:complete